MKDKKMILTSLCAILVLVALGTSFLLKKPENKPNEKDNTPTADALKFKEEYESLNNTTTSGGTNYNNIEVPENNPIKYVNTKETLEVLKNETAIVYVGANWCPWCRNAVPIIFEAAKNLGVETIYYLNLDDEKSYFEVKDGKAVKTTDGTEDYYVLLDYLKDYLRDYTLTSGKKEIKAGEKRIYQPTVITSKDGEVVDLYTEDITLNDNQTPYDELTKEQKDELYQKYYDMFNKVLDKASCHDEPCD